MRKVNTGICRWSGVIKANRSFETTIKTGARAGETVEKMMVSIQVSNSVSSYEEQKAKLGSQEDVDQKVLTFFLTAGDIGYNDIKAATPGMAAVIVSTVVESTTENGTFINVNIDNVVVSADDNPVFKEPEITKRTASTIRHISV